MEERKPLHKQLLHLIASYLACCVMSLLGIAMFEFLLETNFGKVFFQIIQFGFIALALYPTFYDKGLQLCLHEASDGLEIAKKDLKILLIVFFGFIFGSVLLLTGMKVSFLPDLLFLYKILNIPFWGSLMIVMEPASVAQVSWAAIGLGWILPLMYVVVVLTGVVFGYQNITVRGVLCNTLGKKKRGNNDDECH